MAISKAQRERHGRSVGKAIDLHARLRECITEEDVEIFYRKLMAGVEGKMPADDETFAVMPHTEAMKMFAKLVVPEKEKIETNDKRTVPAITPQVAAALTSIFDRYAPKGSKNVTNHADKPRLPEGEGTVRPGEPGGSGGVDEDVGGAEGGGDPPTQP